MKNYTEKVKKILKSPHRWPVIVAIVAGLLFGLLISGGGSDSHDHETIVKENMTAKKAEIWTCSMHPQIKQPKPGKCPICGMDLILATSNEGETGPRELKLSPAAIKLAEIRVKTVERKYVSNEIRMVGKIEYDETRLKYIASRIPGRIDRLYVDYTGTRVKKGDHLVYLYSPELITAQQELQQAKRTLIRSGSNRESMVRKTAERLLEASREKLRLWGLTNTQIKNIENSKKPQDHLTIYSPMAGIVIHKKAVEGAYIKTGSRIYTIADLSQVWIKLDAYESDLPWIRYGQDVEFETEAHPGEIFKGRISFIDPILNPRTRTVKVRVNVKNKNYKLKPNMFVKAVVHSKLSSAGKVLAPELAGKWISPMHPEIIKDKPGRCDICGMPLVKAEKLGYFTDDRNQNQEAPLVIPVSAPLITGTRAVVYVAVPGKEGHFDGREIKLGPRAGNFYIVKEGLKKGEKVVVNGAFKIDSDLQIQAKPSMMSPKGGIKAPSHDHSQPSPQKSQATKSAKVDHSKMAVTPATDVPMSFKHSIDKVAESYFNMQHALSSDDFPNTLKFSKDLIKKVNAVDMSLVKGKDHMDWMKMIKEIIDPSKKLIEASDIKFARTHFEFITKAITGTIIKFGSHHKPVYRLHCPMAFDGKGAYWLQKNKDTRNPYFGESMLTCSDSTEELIQKKKK